MAKKRNRNLKPQLWYGISKCFKEGVDKRAVKKENGCTQNSINTYANSLFKIEKVLNKAYGFNLDWGSDISIPIDKKAHSGLRGANNAIRREDYNKILNYAERNISQSDYALRIQDFLGVRVEEVARII